MAKAADPFAANCLDPKLLANFLVQLNICRRNILAYPVGHPAIAATCRKVADLLAQLLTEVGDFTLGVARRSLLVGSLTLGEKNPVYEDLAQALFDRGIVAATFVRGLEPKEVLRFNEFLIQHRAEPCAGEVIASILNDACIRHIRAQAIRYDHFQISEEKRIAPSPRERLPPSTDLWEKLVENLMAGVNPTATEEGRPTAIIDPTELAIYLNDSIPAASGNPQTSYSEAIISFLRELDRERISATTHPESCDKLRAFIGRLNPELRAQFLHSTFTAMADGKSSAEALLTHLPEETILTALNDVNERNVTLPPGILGILEKLARHSHGERKTAKRDSDEAEQATKLKRLFQEERTAEYVPETYQTDLHTLVRLDRIGILDEKETEPLRKTILEAGVESQVAAIILELIPTTCNENEAAALERNLLEICPYFLELGNFTSLLRIYTRLEKLRTSNAATPSTRFHSVREFFSQNEFVDGVLDGLALWGKSRRSQIQSLIKKIGEPFVEPLLDRLAEESNRALRRLYMNCLVHLGPAARRAILTRLDDERWYVVRNMVVLLRHLKDAELLPFIGRFIAHPHPRVRQEVLRTFLHLHHPGADQLLLRALATTERETKLCAVQLAEYSRHPEVFAKLLSCLHRGGMVDFEFDLKIAVVRTLAAIGNPDALSELAKVLRAKNFLHPILHQSLRKEILGSLGKYPPSSVLPLLEEFAGSDSSESGCQIDQLRQHLSGMKS